MAKEYLDIFGKDNYFIEIQDHGIPEEQYVTPFLVQMAKDLGVGLVATNDCHYVYREDADFHDILLCVQTGRTRDDETRMTFDSDNFYIKSRTEMEELFGAYPEALDNTVKIAERCHINLDKHPKVDIPEFDVPEGFTLESYLCHLCEEGLQKRYEVITPELRQRLDYELGIINEMKFPGYFLIIWDLINYCRKNKIWVGPGRGSAAGSLVAYTLGITNIDPIRYNLIFERFLNPERVSMPDIDTDFCVVRRGEVIDYLVEKYGADKVGQIATFGTMKAKMVVKDVGRALNMTIPDVNRITKLIPNDLKMTIQKALDESTELRELYENEPMIKELLDYSIQLEGMPRHAGTHAAGVVIAPAPITDYMPVMKLGENIMTTQFEKEQVEEQGLLKMDILGLRTLTVIGDALANIKKSRGIDIDIDKIPMDDAKTYEMLSNGDSGGVFQLESDGMRSYMKALHPERIEDIIALVALYRPGPLGSGMVEDFIKRKHGETEVVYLHPLLEDVLSETYGVMLYQEQVMQVASTLAGFTLGQADELRRAMGKKKPEVLAKKRVDFLAGTDKKGIDRKVAGEIFDLMEYFSGYGFNKSHSAAYAVVSYQTAWLRCNYGPEFMAAMLTSFMETAEKVTVYLDECRKMGITILPPDINESYTDFTVVDGKIRFGLAAVKGIGRDVVDHIIEEREQNGPFTSLGDLSRRLLLNKRVVEGLIKAGALDCFGARRSQLMAVYEKALELGKQYAQEKASLQISLFDFGMEEQKVVEVELPMIEEYNQMELLNMEKESIGFFISGHPMDEYEEIIRNVATHNTMKLADVSNNARVKIAGLISQNQPRLTKKGDSMSIFNLEDKMGSVRCLAFPRAYAECRSFLQDGAVVLVDGKAQVEEERVTIFVDSVHLLTDLELLDAPKSQELPPEKPDEKNRYYGKRNGNGGASGKPRNSSKVGQAKSKGVLYVRVENSSRLKDLKSYAKEYPGAIDLIPYYMETERYHRGLGIMVGTEAVSALKENFGEKNVVLRLAKES